MPISHGMAGTIGPVCCISHISTRPIALRNRQTAPSDPGARQLLIALAGVLLFHGGLLPFTRANTCDAFIHMFFDDPYHRNWFDPWEPRWYKGFAPALYPPGTHRMIAALMPLRAAFVVVQLTGLVVLTIGTHRFALLWVPARAAGYAAIAFVLSSSISETAHLFGQLPTFLSLGGWRNFLAAVTFSAATTAAHPVTTLFGGVLFNVPLALQALRAVVKLNPLPGPTPSGSQTLEQLRTIFTGSKKLDRLPNGVVIWEKPDVAPLPRLQPRHSLGHIPSLIWAILPPSVLTLTAAIFLISLLERLCPNSRAPLADVIFPWRYQGGLGRRRLC